MFVLLEVVCGLHDASIMALLSTALLVFMFKALRRLNNLGRFSGRFFK